MYNILTTSLCHLSLFPTGHKVGINLESPSIWGKKSIYPSLTSTQLSHTLQNMRNFLSSPSDSEALQSWGIMTVVQTID